MCDTCGCMVTDGNRHLIEAGNKADDKAANGSAIEVLSHLLDENDHIAAHNREHFDGHQVLVINLMSSPGSGKTSLLEATIQQLKEQYRIAVIEGDLETENDAARIREHGVPAVQITTGTACHLDAHLVHRAVHQLNLDDIDILFIENVGNLVCPASFDLGQHYNVTLLSSTEGDDKPAKYPVIFRAADVVLITKSDLLEVLGDFSPQQAQSHLRNLANPAPMLTLSSRSGAGLETWLDWLHQAREQQQSRVKTGVSRKPAIQAERITA
ncbi:hydrogenase nickel incorporation protein HypB [Candidatus Venteria ishoeyi]|uniref:Hydrogenase maturation factor HypB n=1 Tax=Candidatus Venteria ishoeyi TaxID=1899563 RepID=A0A1H6FJD9_9GAMM|nr:hydrogenase nickel incorporation protein HypB [Candidatus Venteria ishoeyi]SEH09206.1 Hydrogenase isoenzymes nickel incorporation protein HypB [Candidatus Venteria ishoeyi]SEH09331.1 Hydrogenase isoenzymes nickel incorporation protein HypB [Candidatus Venteria ishoeyi]